MKAGLFSWHEVCPCCGHEQAVLSQEVSGVDQPSVPDEIRRLAALKTLRKQNFALVLARLRNHRVTTGMRLLDVGSAHGWLLELAQEEYEVLGVEPVSHLAESSTKRGLPGRQGFFPDALQADERFDVILFNDVLEHIEPVQACLNACRHHLAPGGLLVLNLPSSEGFFYKLSRRLVRLGWQAPFERMWQKGFPSPHVHYFHRAGLQELAVRTGFSLVDHFTLPVLSAAGLWERIQYAREYSTVSAMVQYGGAQDDATRARQTPRRCHGVHFSYVRTAKTSRGVALARYGSRLEWLGVRASRFVRQIKKKNLL